MGPHPGADPQGHYDMKRYRDPRILFKVTQDRYVAIGRLSPPSKMLYEKLFGYLPRLTFLSNGIKNNDGPSKYGQSTQKSDVCNSPNAIIPASERKGTTSPICRPMKNAAECNHRRFGSCCRRQDLDHGKSSGVLRP